MRSQASGGCATATAAAQLLCLRWAEFCCLLSCIVACRIASHSCLPHLFLVRALCFLYSPSVLANCFLRSCPVVCIESASKRLYSALISLCLQAPQSVFPFFRSMRCRAFVLFFFMIRIFVGTQPSIILKPTSVVPSFICHCLKLGELSAYDGRVVRGSTVHAYLTYEAYNLQKERKACA